MHQRLLQPGERIRVLVVDDSVVIRRLVTQVLGKDPAIEVVGTASNGELGLQRIAQLRPDVLTLDIEMPGMDGLEMLRCVRRDFPELRVIMFSTLTERGAEVTLEALSLGADDYVTKASNEGSLEQSMCRLKEKMIPRIKQFFRSPEVASVPSPAHGQAFPLTSQASGKVLPAPAKKRPQVVVIGVSTGGPNALGAILPQLPARFPLPVLIVQHMPPLFTRLLAERLNAVSALEVAEAAEGVAVEAGKVLIAPGDFHMRLSARKDRTFVTIDQSPQENFCRPAVDALFRSAAAAYNGAALALVLTGMGQDGLRGVEMLRASGATVLIQDEPTSVVWGMPGAIAAAGLADRTLPLDQIVPEIMRIIEGN